MQRLKIDRPVREARGERDNGKKGQDRRGFGHARCDMAEPSAPGAPHAGGKARTGGAVAHAPHGGAGARTGSDVKPTDQSGITLRGFDAALQPLGADSIGPAAPPSPAAVLAA